MTWIKTIPFADATGRLLELYQRVASSDDEIDNIMLAHSLRPHSMEGHMHLYKYVLHHSGNTVDKWFLETIGVYVSLLNDCGYCVEHHLQGLNRLLGDPARAAEIRTALEDNQPTAAFEAGPAAALAYARKLTQTPWAMVEADISELRDYGYDDGAILEINQVTAYFNYANRTVLGLGVTTEGDILGLSPNQSEDPNDWGHS